MLKSPFVSRDKYEQEVRKHGLTLLRFSKHIERTVDLYTKKQSEIKERDDFIGERDDHIAYCEDRIDAMRRRAQVAESRLSLARGSLFDMQRDLRIATEQRDNAWQALHEIRDAINADPEEATADEVRACMVESEPPEHALARGQQ